MEANAKVRGGITREVKLKLLFFLLTELVDTFKIIAMYLMFTVYV